MFEFDFKISPVFSETESAVVYEGDCLELMKSIPDKTIQLIVTSPPYNIGKEYEKKLDIETYIAQQKAIIKDSYRILKDTGSICWQVGNFVDKGQIIPLDIILYPVFIEMGYVMRNRMIWHFEHGLHCKNRFSGRYESIIWFTKDTKDYVFNLDPVRVPQKYPNKRHFKGPNVGKLSGNPNGKNPGDVWSIPNVKCNHVEKTDHPCQFPVGLIERLVLSMSNENDWILDPFLGSGTSIIAALKNNRKGAGADIFPKYIDIAKKRIEQLSYGTLKTRPMNKPVYKPPTERKQDQLSIFDLEEKNENSRNVFPFKRL